MLNIKEEDCIEMLVRDKKSDEWMERKVYAVMPNGQYLAKTSSGFYYCYEYAKELEVEDGEY